MPRTHIVILSLYVRCALLSRTVCLLFLSVYSLPRCARSFLMCKQCSPSLSQPSGLPMDEAPSALVSRPTTCPSGRQSSAPVTPLLGTARLACQQERAMVQQTSQVGYLGSSSPSPTRSNQSGGPGAGAGSARLAVGTRKSSQRRCDVC